MNVVLAVTLKVDEFRNRLFLRRVNQTERIFLHTTRLSISKAPTIAKIRISILVRATGIVEAELLAETRLQTILHDYKVQSRDEIELKRLKPRQLFLGTLSDESEGILNLLRLMRNESSKVVTSVDAIEIG